MYIDFKDDAQLEAYINWLVDDNTHDRYVETVEHAHEMSVHINGEKPGKLLTDYRPNEPAEVYNYRMSIWQPITKSSSKRVINTVSRINNSRYYSIKYPEMPSRISDGEDLETYCTKNYPYYGNVVNWMFEVGLKQMLADPNSVIAVRPTRFDTPDNEYIKPYGFVYRSDQIVDVYPDSHYTILLDEKSLVKVANKEVWEGNIYHVYTSNEIIELRQVGEKNKDIYEAEILTTHNLGEPPVITFGGEVVQNTFPFIYESFMAGVLPFWNDALREWSDKQANFVQHVYLERVELQVQCDNTGCMPRPELNGMYGVVKGDGCEVCQRCSGTGFISGRSPYGVTVVKEKDAMSPNNDKQIFPGVQYIDKPTEIVELLKKDIYELIDAGFEAINMDILNKVGENQSGVAKTIDRSDLDAYLLSISNQLFTDLEYLIKYINHFRYSAVLGDYSDYLPSITRPTNFDVLTNEILAGILKGAKQAGLSPHLIDELEKDYVNKQFGTNEDLRRRHTYYIDLDPLSNVSEEDKFQRLANGGITKVDYIMSSNIKQFVDRAIEGVDNFGEMTRTERIAILRGYANEQLQQAPQFNLLGDDGE